MTDMTPMTKNMLQSYTLGAIAIGGLLLTLAEEAHVQRARADQLEGENRTLVALVNGDPQHMIQVSDAPLIELDINELYASCTQDLNSIQRDNDRMVDNFGATVGELADDLAICRQDADKSITQSYRAHIADLEGALFESDDLFDEAIVQRDQCRQTSRLWNFLSQRESSSY